MPQVLTLACSDPASSGHLLPLFTLSFLLTLLQPHGLLAVLQAQQVCSYLPAFVLHTFSEHLFFFLIFLNAYFWEGDRDRVQTGGGAEREGDTESKAGSVLTEESHMRGSNPNREIMTWAETKIWTLNRLSHLGTPHFCFLLLGFNFSWHVLFLTLMGGKSAKWLFIK